MIKLFCKLKAFILRTFVTDCPKCHKHFYGHKRHGIQIKIDNVHYRIICDKCFNKSMLKAIEKF